MPGFIVAPAGMLGSGGAAVGGLASSGSGTHSAGATLDWWDDFRSGDFTDKGLAFLVENAPMDVITVASATGTWPTGITHVAENSYTPEGNAGYQAVNLWPSPAINEFLFFRMLLNNSLPNGANTGGDHGFQTNLNSPLSWFLRIWGGDADSFTFESTTWDDNELGSVDQLQVDAPKDTVLRVETRVERTGTSSALYSVRLYNNQTGSLLGEVLDLPRSGAAGGGANHFREYVFGMSGQLGATHTGGSVYWGAVGVRVSASSSAWIGAYPVAGVES